MALDHAQPNEVIDIRPVGDALANQRTTTLFKSEQLEVLRLVMQAGKVIPEHQAPGEITVQCLEGRIVFTAGGQPQELTAGHMLYLRPGDPHALEAIEPSAVLVTLALPRKAAG